MLQVFSSAEYPVSYAHAKATNTCIRCGRPAERFSDASARLEYTVSALCEDCQDEPEGLPQVFQPACQSSPRIGTRSHREGTQVQAVRRAVGP